MDADDKAVEEDQEGGRTVDLVACQHSHILHAQVLAHLQSDAQPVSQSVSQRGRQAVSALHIYVHINAHICIYTHICIDIYMHVGICTHICVFIDVCKIRMYTYMFICVYACEMHIIIYACCMWMSACCM